MSILQMSVSCALIIITATLVRALAIDRLPKTTFLALWGVALCRLLILFSVPAASSTRTATRRDKRSWRRLRRRVSRCLGRRRK
ncbi:MAG: hypothetical protein LBS84_05955 [Clostridiales bacterium]|nr:hypothetical protein [Clostridiales bacterium]